MKLHYFFILIYLMCNAAYAEEKTTIRLGVQTGGTLAWELTALTNTDSDFELVIHPLANAQEGKNALQTGDVDVIVSDWIWVADQRQQGEDFTFYQYSDMSGALIVPKDSPIKSIQDLVGKRLGIAGGELDKNWLLLQALAQKQSLDLNKSVDKTFATPTKITEQLKAQEIDAALTYWHFAAQLEGQGYRQLMNDKNILNQLNIQETVPNIGYVFKHNWGMKHQTALNHFFKAAQQARKQLCTDDTAWQKVLPLTKTEDAATQTLLRQRFCEGNIDKQWGEKEQQAAAQLFKLLKKQQQTDSSEDLQTKIFWTTDLNKNEFSK
jgi:NitT/TauT family transport system substrate-binding protein